METNLQRCERLGMMGDDTLMELSEGRRCEFCDKLCKKNLSPSSPSCEGRWCDEALEYWLEEEANECV